MKNNFHKCSASICHRCGRVLRGYSQDCLCWLNPYYFFRGIWRLVVGAVVCGYSKLRREQVKHYLMIRGEAWHKREDSWDMAKWLK